MVFCDVLSAASVFIVLLAMIYGGWQAIFFATLVSSILSQFSQPAGMKLFKLYIDRLLTNIYALLAHLVVGGLLTVQIQSAFEEYGGATSHTLLSLTLSCVWGVYALLLFLWGSYYKQTLFLAFGSLVLVGVAIKAIFLDLSGEQAIYKILTLLVLGLISFLISVIRNKWSAAAEGVRESEG